MPSSSAYDVLTFILNDTPGLDLIKDLFWGPDDFPVCYSNRDTPWNAWNHHWGMCWPIRGFYLAVWSLSRLWMSVMLVFKTFRSWVVICHLHRPMMFLTFILYDTPGLALIKDLFWGPGDFPVSYSNRDTPWNAWNQEVVGRYGDLI